MSKNRLDVSDSTAISMPVRNMLAIIAAVAMGAWAYFGVLERITMLETKSVLTEKDINQHVERLELDDKTGIDEIKVPEVFVGRSLRDLNLRKNYFVNVLAAGPAQLLTVNPPAKYILEKDHVLVVMGSMEDLQKLPQT